MGETLTPPAPPPDYTEELEQEAAGIAARRSAVPPEFRTQPAPPRAPRTGTEALIEGLPPSMQPIAQEQLRMLQQTGGGGSQVATARRDLELARGEREAREQYAQQYGERLRRYEGERIATPDFLPTPENAMSLGTLFGLIATAGTLLGTKGNQSAMGALQAMNGMMTGWRQGRADLYNRERQNFETEMRRVQAQNEELRRGFQDDLKLMQTNMDAGMARARERAAQAGVSIASAGAARQGAQAYLSWLSSLQSTMAQIERQRQTASNAAPIVVPRQAADGTTSFYYAHRDGSPIMGQDGQPLPAPPPRSAGAAAGRVGEIQNRYNIAVSNAVSQAGMEIGNIAGLPAMANPPILNNYVADPNKTVTEGLLRFMGQRMSTTEERATQQILAGVTRAITTIQASGRPGGVTESSLREFSRIAPQPGDSRLNWYLFLALAKQELDLGLVELRNAGASRTQIESATESRDKIAALIPYTVADINRIMVGPRGRALINESALGALQHAGSVREAERALSRAARERPSGPQSRVATQADIEATMQQNNMTREQVINALRQRGFTIEGE